MGAWWRGTACEPSVLGHAGHGFIHEFGDLGFGQVEPGGDAG
jgi:hypothetical protein